MHLVSYAALIGTSSILLLVWIKIWIYGVGGFYEYNIAMRLWETILWTALILLGVSLFISLILNTRKNKKC